jgi:hypothetical protein
MCFPSSTSCFYETSSKRELGGKQSLSFDTSPGMSVISPWSLETVSLDSSDLFASGVLVRLCCCSTAILTATGSQCWVLSEAEKPLNLEAIEAEGVQDPSAAFPLRWASHSLTRGTPSATRHRQKHVLGPCRYAVKPHKA